jgi:hypothetical protein
MQTLKGVIMGIPQMFGAMAGGGIQYVYNRINGPGGNMNAMLSLAQALAPNVTMMGAAGAQMPGGGPINLQGMIQGLAQRMPIMGTQQDMLQTILAGQSVGALMQGTPGRNAFFESARQMQVLNPGQSPGTIAGTLAGYIGNTGAQRMGAFMGEGAFTMIGQGGSYKTLAQWAEGITKFFEQHRPGGDQGKSFTPEELIAQNFPGSNINAWFQMMGVPQNMVDYWWQYVLTNSAGKPASDVTSKTLQSMATKTRGLNLGYEQLRTATAATQRDYLMGNQMYSMYAANASANRRFNTVMGVTDQALAQQLSGTNIGRALALLPTPIMEALMPVITQFFSSPVGGLVSAMGASVFPNVSLTSGGGSQGFGSSMLSGLMTMNPVLGPLNAMGGLASGVEDLLNLGDPMPYGDTGGTNLAHLSPDLARRVGAMMRANPNLQVSSGYRDSSTQNRLRAKGATAVGSNKSAHTRGWAVDMGPASQMGWLMQNANKFGLATASNYGEPWHIQRAGTPMVGDPSPMPYGGLGDIFDVASSVAGDIGGLISNPIGTMGGLVGGVLGDLGKQIIQAMQNMMLQIMKPLMAPMQQLISSFIGKGSFSDMIDNATAIFSKMVTAPISAMANLFGPAQGGAPELMQLINGKANITVPVLGTGFTPTPNLNNAPAIFGDPMPFGGPLSMLSSDPTSAGGSAPVLIFHTPITISSGAGSSGIDARQLASTLADHLESEVNKRSWLVS